MIDIYLNISFLTLILGLFFFNWAELTQEQKLIGFSVLITLPFEIYAGYLQSYNINNLFIYHMLIPVQYSFYAYIYYCYIEFKIVKKLILISIGLVITVAVVLAQNIQTPDTYNSYVIIISNFFICIWVLTYYWQLFVQLKIINLKSEPLFWISNGLLLFSLGDFFAEGLMKALLDQSFNLARRIYYYIHVPLLCTLYITFIIAFLCRDIFRKHNRSV